MSIFRRSWTAGIVAVIGLIAVAVLDPTNVARAAIALIALVLPLSAVLWERLRSRFGALATATFAGASSLGMLVVAAIGLNLTPPGLTAYTWLVFAIVVLGMAAFIVRSGSSRRMSLPWAPHEALLGATAVVMVFGAFMLARAFVNVPPESFTELWMLADKTASRPVLSVGVRSSELEAVDYSVEVVADGAVIQRWSLHQLRPGQTWERTLAPQATGKIEARLYRAGAPATVYRHVAVTLPTTGAAG